MKAFEDVQIEVTVENTGNVAGDEVVQMYVRDLYASMARSVKELAGFKRIHLKAGEKKTICFTMKASQIAFLDLDMKWKVETGEFEIQMGSSSEDIRLTDRYFVVADGIVEGKKRGFYAKAELK